MEKTLSLSLLKGMPPLFPISFVNRMLSIQGLQHLFDLHVLPDHSLPGPLKGLFTLHEDWEEFVGGVNQ